jgi:DinB family protein
MNQRAREQLIDDLQNARKQMSTLLLSVAHDQDWQPDAENWSFRYVAAHMAACDKECLQVRIQQIASGENPHFEFYSNTGRDFSGLDLKASLDEWAVTRQEIIDFFRALPDEKLSLTGEHATYGAVTIPDYLKIGLDHDRGHTQELEQMLAEYRKG